MLGNHLLHGAVAKYLWELMQDPVRFMVPILSFRNTIKVVLFSMYLKRKRVEDRK